MNNAHTTRAPAGMASVLVLLALASAGNAQVSSVLARAETVPVPSGGDAADDMVVWVHPTNPGLSRVIGTDKESGLGVYDLQGNQVQFLADGQLNNVDIRYGFPLAPSGVAIVTSGERSQNLIAIYAVDPTTGLLYDVAANLPLSFDVYGTCMYHSPITGDFYFICNSKDGHVEQWRLISAGGGLVTAVLSRTFEVGSTTEGCVADDETGYLFVGEENVGIWRYGAEPGDGSARTLVDTTGVGGNLTADVEGLSIYYGAGGTGYLLASSQGSDTYVVYDRMPPHAVRHTFQIAANVPLGIDDVTGTDGIDVVNLSLGSTFPDGVFLAQDTDNPGANQNFKLVSWGDIAATANPPLLVDLTYDALGALDEQWADLGGGTVGINGPPTLVATGPLTSGSLTSLQLLKAPPSGPFLAWFSLAPSPFPAVGGTLHAFPFQKEFLLMTDVTGTFQGTATWPPGMPADTNVWFQFVVQDLSTVDGITLSNGVLATTP